MSELSASPALLKRLHKLGIQRRFDLVLHLPLRYEDETAVQSIRNAAYGQPVQVEGTVTRCDVSYKPRKQLLVGLCDDSGELLLRFIHFYPSHVQLCALGARLRVLGEVRHGFHGDEMVHPRCRTVEMDTPLAAHLTPIYSTVSGLTQPVLRRMIVAAVQDIDLDDTLPDTLITALSLPSFRAAIEQLHHPPAALSIAQLSDGQLPAWRRLKFDELLAQQLSMRLAWRARRKHVAPVLQGDGDLRARLRASLPFQLTAAQQRVLGEIAHDLQAAHPMHRLLQGDVGSGKTIVAALAALQAIESGYQAALMAPTEILAEQHALKLTAWLAPLGVEVAWLSGSLKKAHKREALAAVAEGRARLVIGTHALFQQAVQFHRLGLVLVDEQHRFGVGQRLALQSKGVAPHQLMMSATPIPRTLAMSYYADLDVSVIDTLPPGRTPIVTKLVAVARRDAVVQAVAAEVAQGRQVYWVCPLIEESETLELQTAQAMFAELSAALPHVAVGLVHGRLKAEEKARSMAAFQANTIQLLVATTVVEVGVDVPNASLMVIEHAERMGLSQLHQLRGRIGRGATASCCILLFDEPLSALARARLKVIYQHTDGFEIARQDLLLRGPGEFLGARQSGVPLLRFASLEDDLDILEEAKRWAPRLLSDYPDHAERHLARWLAGREQFLKA